MNNMRMNMFNRLTQRVKREFPCRAVVTFCKPWQLSPACSIVDRFGKRVQSSDTKLAVFYYAGHGAQLDWRNYLLPVNATVSSATAMKADCIDLGQVLDHFIKAQRKGAEKTFVVILDACRDNPFCITFKPQNKGLSQFDAPVGSLLAYATAPGNVASDGAGKNGLYTENLMKELSRPGVRIEDALKRVRLNVRLSSGGEQIPWESTSLESDVFIFPHTIPKLSEEELERQIEIEVAHWNLIKNLTAHGRLDRIPAQQ